MIVRTRGYARLSRLDVRKGDTLANHVGMLHHLAQQSQLPLEDADVVTEVEASDRIDTRAGLTAILQDLHEGRITHLLVYDVARLSRGLEDQWAAIKRALYRHQAHLVTPRGAYRFDNSLDTTILDVEAVLARRYRWEYSMRRVHHNAERTRRGIRSNGSAPYGYRWVGPTYEGGRKIADGRLEPIPEEYVVLEEILRRIETEGAVTIARDLNARGVPTSGARRIPGAPARLWGDKMVRDMAQNPVYAGYVVHRQEMARERGQVSIPRDRWLWSEAEGTYEHPLTLERWEELQECIRARHINGTPMAGLVTGILWCPRGSRMCRSGERQYSCTCVTSDRGQRSPEPHAGSCVRTHVIESYARRVVDAVLAAVEPGGLPSSGPTVDRRALFAQLAEAQRTLEETTRSLDDLMSRSAFYVSLPGFGAGRYEAAVRTLSGRGEALRARIQALRSQVSRPDPAAAIAVLEAARAIGPALWEDADGWGFEQRRLLVRSVIDRMDLEEPPRRGAFLRSVRVQLHADFAGVAVPPIVPAGRTVGWLSRGRGV